MLADCMTGDSRNKTRPAKVVVVANSKQKCSVRTHNVVKYTSKNFGYDYTLYWVFAKFVFQFVFQGRFFFVACGPCRVESFFMNRIAANNSANKETKRRYWITLQ